MNAIETATLHRSTPLPLDPAKDRWLREQFDWDNVEHLIQSGKIFSLTYDFEATDLNPMFAAPTQFCGKITDVQGRTIDRLKLDIQVPEDVVVSPQAALVTQSRPKDLYRKKGRVPPHIAAGQISMFFRNPYRKLWDMLADHAITITSDSGREEEVRVYTIASPDGSKSADIRIHKGGKELSILYNDKERLPDGAKTYYDPDGTRWKKIAAPAITEGHNIRRYDDRLLWSFLHRNHCDEIFLTHTKKFQRFRVDTLDLAKLVALLDAGHENGFKPGTKISKETGKPYTAFTLSSLMEANTRDANPETGVDVGVRMPDGSKYDRKLAHLDPEYDVDATIALKAYLRKRAPEIVRLVENNADMEEIKRTLIGGEGFEMHPLRAFARYVYPHPPHMHFGVCAFINEEITERRQALMIRTDTDQPLADYTFRGKKLLDMSVDELAAMLESQRGQPDALCEIINLRKNPPLIEAKTAFGHGFGEKPDQQEANRRFVLSHDAFCKKLQEAQTKAMPPLPDWRTIRNPTSEEHLFTPLAAPKRYEFDMDGKKVMLNEAVHKEWVSALRKDRRFDALLRRVLKPQPVEFETRVDSLLAFIDRIKKVDEELHEYSGSAHADDRANAKTRYHVLPQPDANFLPPKKQDTVPDPDNPGKTMLVPHVITQKECAELTANAVEYIWKLRAELMYEFLDRSNQFTVRNRDGQEIPFVELNRMNEADLTNHIRTGEYVIHRESLHWSEELMARMFRDAGRVKWAKDYFAKQGRHEEVKKWEEWEEYFANLKALRRHGAPHEDPDKQRWYTARRGKKDTARLRDNLRNGDLRGEDERWGDWDNFVRNNPLGQVILHESDAEYDKQLKVPLSPQRQRRLGYDPDKRGFPIEHAPYTIPAGANILTLDVPDHVLDKPLSHPDVASNILMLNPSEQERRAIADALASTGLDTFLFLRGAESGRTYLAAKPKKLSSDAISPNAYFKPLYDEGRTLFLNSGMDAPAPEQFLTLSVEALEPVPGKVNEAAQTIKIPRWEDFMATISPTLGYRDTQLTGVVMQHYGITPTTGEARLQGMEDDAHKPGQTESGWEVPTTINNVRTLTLKQALDHIKLGRDQAKAASALGFETVEALRAAAASSAITPEQARAAGFKKPESLTDLINEPSFTPRDAAHYGFANLSGMQQSLSKMFVDHARDKNRDDNLIHFIDIEPAEKKQMCWHRPDRRPMVRLLEAANDLTPSNTTPWSQRFSGAPPIMKRSA